MNQCVAFIFEHVLAPYIYNACLRSRLFLEKTQPMFEHILKPAVPILAIKIIMRAHC